jgi:nucleotide-binding universal stress UspA family protein
VATEIIAYAEREGLDLVAMATHGRTGINRFIMGSIAEKVLRGTIKPILLIRAIPVVPRPLDWREVVVPPAP